AASEVDQRTIEKRAIAVGGSLQFAYELRELSRVVGRYLGVLFDILGLVSVVRDRMMRLGNADVSIAAAASFMTDHEGEDAGNVALEGEAHEVVGHCHVFVERVGNSQRRRGAFRNRSGTAFHAIQLLFDVPDIA